MNFFTLIACLLTFSVYSQDFVNGSYETSCLINTPPVSWDGESTSAGVDCDYWATGVNPGVSPDGGHFIRFQTAHIESIDQTVTGLDIGVTYEVTVYIAGGTGGDFNIYVDDLLVEAFPGASPYEWHSVTTEFVAAGASANIKFEWNLPSGVADGAADGAVIEGSCIPLTTTISSYAICLGDSVTIEGTSATGGAVSWDGGVVNGIPFSPASAGTFTYISTSTSEEDCADTLTLVVHDLPIVEAGEYIVICEGDTVTLTGSGAGDDGTYIWEEPEVINGVEFVPIFTMIYTVAGTALTGCSNTDTVSVIVNFLPSVSAGLDIYTCEGNSVILTGSGVLDGEYEWDGGVIDGEPFVADATTTYTVTATDENGCSNWDDIIVTVDPQPIVEITPLEDDVVCLSNDNITLFAEPSGGIFSGSGLAGPLFSPTVAGIGEHYVYYTYEDEFGCHGIDSVLITVVDCLGLASEKLSTITIAPNPFTEFTTIYFGSDLQNDHAVLIYDMLGQEVYRNETVFASQLQINSSDLAPGTYMLFVYNSGNKNVFSSKLIVQ
ncbi:MAG: T9SS type A sorting domain-containing protein [Crocinitomix sp.]|nr:T9SS type A sorting domain-containing protein [Crocinitomix sp.]